MGRYTGFIAEIIELEYNKLEPGFIQDVATRAINKIDVEELTDLYFEEYQDEHGTEDFWDDMEHLLFTD